MNEEDSNSLTILTHYLFKKDFKMCSRLIVRGADVNYCNRNGNTSLHLCIENNLVDSVQFLLKKGANPHIMDLSGEDSCDKAKRTSLSLQIQSFNNCSSSLKVKPILPAARQ